MTFQERLNLEYANNTANDNNLDVVGFEGEFFGIDNITSFPACLDLRLPNGKRKIIPYSPSMEIDYEPDEGITITTATKTIKITGREMDKLVDYLAAFRVRYIKANEGVDAGESGLFIEKIALLEK